MVNKNLKFKTLALFSVLIIIIFISLVSSEIDKTDTKVDDVNKKIEFSSQVSVSWDSNVEAPKTIENENTFKVKTGGTLNVNYKGDNRVYSGFDYSKSNPEFVFDKAGNLKKAHFYNGESGKNYKLGNKEFFVPKGAEVKYENGEARIKYSEELKIEKPRTISEIKESSEDITVSYESDKGFILDNGDKFKGVLKYKDSNGFFFDSEAKIGDIEVKNPNSVPTYLFYDGEPKPGLNGAYISIDKTKGKLTLGCNINERGPVVKLNEGNPFGVRIEKGDNFAMQALGNDQGSFISIQNRDKEGKVPYVKTLNQWIMNEDGKSVYFNTNDQSLHLIPNEAYLKDFGEVATKTGSTPLEIHGFKTIDGKEIEISKYGNVLGVGNENNFGYGPDPRFIKTHVSAYAISKKAPGLYSGFSNSLVYNYDQTLRGLEKFTGIPINDETGTLKDPKNVKMLMDMFAGIPTSDLKKWGIRQFNIVSRWNGWSGLADPNDMNFYVNVRNGGFKPSTIRHELTHIHDFTFDDNSNFNKEWRAIGGNKGPHTYDYGYTSAEDTSTLGEFTYRTDPWKEWLSSSYKYNEKFRGRIAVFVKYGFMSRDEAARLYTLGGLPADASDNMLNKYIADARSAFRTKG